MKFGAVLRELLEDNEITQKQLAEDLNIAPSTLGNYIRGIREPDFQMLKLFAAYFNVTTDYLLDYQSGGTQAHSEDDLLQLYRILVPEKRELLLEQAKLLLRMQMREKTRKGKSR